MLLHVEETAFTDIEGADKNKWTYLKGKLLAM